MTVPGQQFVQLPMFMTAREILATHAPNEGDRQDVYDKRGEFVGRETDKQLWARKYKAAGEVNEYVPDEPPVRRSVLKEGVKTPVSLEDPVATQAYRAYEPLHQPQIYGGHHRIAVMAKKRPDDLIPVAHVWGTQDAWDTEQKHGGYVG